MRHDSLIYVYSNLLTDLLYVQYLHAVWLSRKTLISQCKLSPLPSHGPFIYIYIGQSHDCCIFSLVTVLGNMYNLCKLHSLICMHSSMHSSCHSLSDCTFLYKYGYETSPFYKKNFFVIELLVAYYIQVYELSL